MKSLGLYTPVPTPQNQSFVLRQMSIGENTNGKEGGHTILSPRFFQAATYLTVACLTILLRMVDQPYRSTENLSPFGNRGNRLSHFLSVWPSIHSDKWVPSTVKLICTLHFLSSPHPSSPAFPVPFQVPTHSSVQRQEVQSLCSLGGIQVIEVHPQYWRKGS